MGEIFAPAMFLCLVLALFFGFPVAFTLAAVGGAFGIIGITTGHFHPAFLINMVFRIQGVFNNDNLLALPLAAAGMVTPWLAALGMALSSLAVTANALRLAKVAPR